MNRTFVNKLWNIGKFVQHSTSGCGAAVLREKFDFDSLPITEKYIISRLHTTVIEVTRCMEQYAFAEMARLVYDFVWGELADWYVEASKTRYENSDHYLASRRCLVYALDMSLRLLHPIMPHISEVK